jgi:hypothetical protein
MSKTRDPAKIKTVAIIENNSMAVMGELSQYAGMSEVSKPFA